jgi:hypothetical protein
MLVPGDQRNFQMHLLFAAKDWVHQNEQRRDVLSLHACGQKKFGPNVAGHGGDVVLDLLAV